MKKNIILILIILYSALVFAQEKKVNALLYIYYEPQSEYAAGYKIATDSLTANFNIYYKEYITKENRERALKEYKQKVKKQEQENSAIDYIKVTPKIKKPVFYKWIACDSPINVTKGELPEYITLEDYITGKLRFKDTVTIIFKINDNEYLMWKGFHFREK
ncbi:hypothetical protein GN157_05140 [Flavobacterium rakeshii]|uniref:Uncharacterized protein n=1 Tax=Flavobacterium rakeshii TaxID=1038845 RepID=A0A6N8H910_9FLAO|nr:hypothetical protein [Flavobacterium rakeshii]MUV03089.1 hypothetical protein [Flavobacterium rakeshii]